MLLKRAYATYSPEKEIPIGSYAALMALYGLHLGAFVRWASRRRLPKLLPTDFILLALATHKLARIVARDWVTIPLRAPFTTYDGPQSGGEVSESVRGSGVRQALGSLLTCPFCTGPWVAAPLVYAWAASPKLGRLVASIFGAVTVSDFLHRGYALLDARQEQIQKGSDWAEVLLDKSKAELRS